MVSTCIITDKIGDKLLRAVQSVEGLGETVIVGTRGIPPEIYIPQSAFSQLVYYDYPWRDDFSAARNFALEKAKFPLIFSLDSDEWIDEGGRRALFAISNSNPDTAYLTNLIDCRPFPLSPFRFAKPRLSHPKI